MNYVPAAPAAIILAISGFMNDVDPITNTVVRATMPAPCTIAAAMNLPDQGLSDLKSGGLSIGKRCKPRLISSQGAMHSNASLVCFSWITINIF